MFNDQQYTLFKAVYHRFTPFSIEDYEFNISGTGDFGKKIDVRIPKVGDLLTDMTLVIDLPEISGSYVFENKDEYLNSLQSQYSFTTMNDIQQYKENLYKLKLGQNMQAYLVRDRILGKYQLILQAEGVRQQQPITLMKDPESKATPEQIKEQYNWGKILFAAIERAHALIEKMERERASLLKTNTTASLKREDAIYQLEAQLIDVHQTGARWDSFRNPSQLFEHLLGLSKEALTMGADYPPTSQQKKVLEQLQQQLQSIETSYQKI
ncbi:MAG: hypothetical protein FGM61_05035 [Sediminibacterium sp.]|nr:hypothetical protein [Sediminibacterium sp.]